MKEGLFFFMKKYLAIYYVIGIILLMSSAVFAECNCSFKEENFVGKKRFGIRTIWILKSGIDTIKINEKPTLIWTPHLFERPLEDINYDFGKLFSKLKDPKVKITEFILDPKSRIDRRRIR